MKTVLFLTDLHVGSHIAEVEGVYERARTYGWHVVEVEYAHSIRPIEDYVRTWRPDGCILTCAPLTEPLAPEVFKDIPTIYLDPDARTLRRQRHCVVNDPEALAQIAFQELMNLPCAACGFVGWSNRTVWSEGRRQAFGRLVEGAGLPFVAFTDPWDPEDKLRLHKKLARWIRELPKPCGIFAANDDTASLVADVCHFVGLEVPKDIAVIGVDNMELVCENAMTTLSSIEIDFHDVGRACADLLARLLADPDLPPETVRFGPGRLVRRQSTRALQTCDARVSRALERIRREASLGLRAADVIADMGISRRMAEQRFRAATGKTILEEINDTRLAHAFALLRRPDYPISLIAEQCGWKADVFLKRLFKKKTGMTMREWRKSRAAPAAAK